MPVPTTDIEITDLTTTDDPYPVFEQLRSHGPVVRTPAGFWMVVGHDAANQVVRDRRMMSGPIADRYRASLPPGAARDEMSHRINFLDPPDHPRVRSLVQATFTPRRLATLARWIHDECVRVLHTLHPNSHGEIDLLAGFAHPLPSTVISEMLGVPADRREELTTWTEAVTPLLGVALTTEQRAVAIDAAEQFASYAADLLAERRALPGHDLLTELATASNEDGRLSEPELLSLVVTLYSAGHRTTRDLFINGLFALLRQPEQLADVRADPTLAAPTVREFLRFETPTLYVARVPAEPVDVGGVRIGAGEPTIVVLAAANRCPVAYEAPNRFDLHRGGPAPLSFAAGPHHCLGANLARLEAETMLTTLLQRFPTLSVPDHDPPQWLHRGPFRGLTHGRVQTVAAKIHSSAEPAHHISDHVDGT